MKIPSPNTPQIIYTNIHFGTSPFQNGREQHEIHDVFIVRVARNTRNTFETNIGMKGILANTMHMNNIICKSLAFHAWTCYFNKCTEFTHKKRVREKGGLFVGCVALCRQISYPLFLLYMLSYASTSYYHTHVYVSNYFSISPSHIHIYIYMYVCMYVYIYIYA